jgi:hypothetical protein
LILIVPAALLAAVAIVFAVFATSSPSVSSDPTALARVNMPLGGGKVVSVHATNARGREIPITVTNGRIVPTRKLKPGEQVTIVAVVQRPGWIGWLGGSRDTETLTLRTPTTLLESKYLTVPSGAPLRLTFSRPVSTFAYGRPGALRHQTFARPHSVVTIARPAPAGTLAVAAAPRAWESAGTAFITWFPAGAGSSAVANPAPGSQLLPASPITLTFSKPVSQILGAGMPKMTPVTTGHWTTRDSHTIVFKPSGYGYGLDTTVNVVLPSGVKVVGEPGSDPSWTVPSATSLRLNQILAQLGYLPVRWRAAGRAVKLTPAAELAAAVQPPDGAFSWRYSNTPGSLQAQWNPNQQTIVSQGALDSFEQSQGVFGTDPSPSQVWHMLIAAAIKNQHTSFGYTYVMVSEGSPESLDLWHNGRTVLTTPVNTGISVAPTALGTFPVFEHVPVTTMSGTNPDGSHYSDPGIPWVSYFNGGDALHGFIRASYGSPQSLGCVEMPFSTAGQVYPYTPIGTLVNVA